MFGFLKSFFKSKAEKDLSELTPVVSQVAHHFDRYRQLSDDELRDLTLSFRTRIATHLDGIQQRIAAVDAEIEQAKQENRIADQEALFTRKDELRKERNQALEEILEELLPEAFATVKETCRRLVENGQLKVRATDFDRDMNARKGYPKLEDGYAIWPRTWNVTGQPVTWDMVHYDVQLMGGAVLHRGKIAEMATGEGKTLVSTLPAYLNALSGFGVHIVTVNDYLARRDSEWNAPIFEFHQLRVDCVDLHEPNTDERRLAYASDIVYGTNNEFGFDYLRDNMALAPDHLVQREHHFAIVDEIDSVLVDEARTPLIISGPAPLGDRHEFNQLKPRIEKLVRVQNGLVTTWLAKAKDYLQKGDKENAGLWLLRCHRALPKYRPLLKFLSEPGIKELLTKTENYYMADSNRQMPKVDEELLFVIEERNNQVDLTEKGRETLTREGEEADFFVLPDLASELNAIDQRSGLSSSERVQMKEELSRKYAERSERLHSVHQLLKAYTLFERDVEYIVQDGKVMIVDENTGRVLPGRRWSDGLHQAVEAKENVKIESITQTYATITLQNYFRMYHKLAGMTGTAETESAEFYQIYKLDVVVVPTHRPIVRKDLDDLVYKTKREKYNAIIDEIQTIYEAGRPVLVGTTSVEVSELLSRMVKQRLPQAKDGLKVLNAKYHQQEAEIVAAAGQQGAITIATNMAGRGTDIKLGPGVREAGGLAIIGSERHDSRRIDRQLRGRAGRQGDPGSSQFFVSLEDDLMRLFGSERVSKMMDFMKVKEGEVMQAGMLTRFITNAQKKVEENNFSMRKRLLEYDDVMNHQREVIYRRRRNALFGDRLKMDLDNTLQDFCSAAAERYHAEGDAEGLRMFCLQVLAFDPGFSKEDFDRLGAARLSDQLYDLARKTYDEKEARIAQTLHQHIREVRLRHPEAGYMEIFFADGTDGLRIVVDLDELLATEGHAVINTLEKAVSLHEIDEAWKEHLREMDELKQGVQTAYLEQKDPLLIYKFEAFELFQRMLDHVNTKVLGTLFRAEPAKEFEQQRAPVQQRADFSRMNTRHDEAQSGLSPELVAAAAGQMDGMAADGGRKLSRAERREQERLSKKKR
jgi:preprotein translocase subunit SecA